MTGLSAPPMASSPCEPPMWRPLSQRAAVVVETAQLAGSETRPPVPQASGPGRQLALGPQRRAADTDCRSRQRQSSPPETAALVRSDARCCRRRRPGPVRHRGDRRCAGRPVGRVAEQLRPSFPAPDGQAPRCRPVRMLRAYSFCITSSGARRQQSVTQAGGGFVQPPVVLLHRKFVLFVVRDDTRRLVKKRNDSCAHVRIATIWDGFGAVRFGSATIPAPMYALRRPRPARRVVGVDYALPGSSSVRRAVPARRNRPQQVAASGAAGNGMRRPFQAIPPAVCHLLRCCRAVPTARLYPKRRRRPAKSSITFQGPSSSKSPPPA